MAFVISGRLGRLYWQQTPSLSPAPTFVCSANAPEFIVHALKRWCKRSGITTTYMEPESPWQNGFAESFHSRFRDEFRNTELFDTVAEAQGLADRWRWEYNTLRPHSALQGRTPLEAAPPTAAKPPTFIAPAPRRGHVNINETHAPVCFLTSLVLRREMNSIAKGKQQGRLPDFIVIGATKAGTTSLDFYLSLHPEIQIARPKEPRFFIDAPDPAGRWQRGLDWYRSLFVSDKTLCGEVSPTYTHAPALPGVPERMARIVPEARLIYLVREPFERLKSHFLMQCRQKGESLGLADFLAANPEACCLLASEYGSQLKSYLNWFPRRQILVVESEQLARNRVNTLRRIFEFLGVDVGFFSPLFHHRRNVTGHQRIANEMGQRLLHSRVMTLAKTSLPDSVFYHLRNLALTPFTQEPPSINLPEKLRDEIYGRFRSEMSLLRKQCGQALPSLGHE